MFSIPNSFGLGGLPGQPVFDASGELNQVFNFPLLSGAGLINPVGIPVGAP